MEPRRESEVLAGILAYLETRQDLFFWRQNTAAVKLAPDRFVKFGVPGMADILVCQAPLGRLIGIEVKREGGGELTPDQKWWGKMLLDHGGLYVVARRIEDVAGALGEPMARIVKEFRRRRVFPR